MTEQPLILPTTDFGIASPAPVPTPRPAISYPTIDKYEVPPNDPNAKAGYTFDPYADPCQLADIYSPNIPFHNYRQRHVSQIAYGEGFRATSLKEIPRCPPMWQDVAHYWDSVAVAGYLSFEYMTKDSLMFKAATVLVSMGAAKFTQQVILPAAGIQF